MEIGVFGIGECRCIIRRGWRVDEIGVGSDELCIRVDDVDVPFWGV